MECSGGGHWMECLWWALHGMLVVFAVALDGVSVIPFLD